MRSCTNQLFSNTKIFKGDKTLGVQQRKNPLKIAAALQSILKRFSLENIYIKTSMQICPYHFSRISWNLHFNFFNSSEYWGAYYSVEICDDCFKRKIIQGLYLSLNWHSEIKLAIKDNFSFSQQIIRCVLSLITRDIDVSWQRGSYNEFPRRNFPEQTTWDNFGTSHIMLQLQKCLF